MKISEYLSHDAVGIAALVARGEVDATEPAQCALDVISRYEPAVAALAEVYNDRAADSYVAAVPKGPLYGVPMVMKDLVCHEAGQILEAGSRLGQGLRVPTATDLATRFHAAGLVNVGRSKSPEMGFNLSTENRLHGPVHNPWKQGVSAGGSSGGSAAAVAAGMVPIGHANDGGGSIRIPASACGIIGLKPSRGRVPIGPDAADGLNGLGVELAVTRSVRDMAAVLDAVEGPGIGDPYEIARPQTPYAQVIASDPKPLRIALWRETPSATKATAEVTQALNSAAARCRDLGHEVEEAVVDLGVSWDAFILANARVWCANMMHWVEDLAAVTGRPVNHETLENTTLACVEFGRSLDAMNLLRAFDVFNIVSRKVGALLTRYDVILSPTMPRPPVPHGVFNADAPGISGVAWTAQIFEASPYTGLFNVTGLPAISLPMGWSDSLALPIGMQFAAGFGREDGLLQLAAQLERAQAWTVTYPRHLINLLQ